MQNLTGDKVQEVDEMKRKGEKIVGNDVNGYKNGIIRQDIFVVVFRGTDFQLKGKFCSVE